MVQALKKHPSLFGFVAVLLLIPMAISRSWWNWFLPPVLAEHEVVESALLRAGIVPLPMLESIVDDWIAAVKAAQAR